MAASKDAASGAQDMAEEVARLRAQVEALMREKVAPVMADLADRAEDAFDGASDTLRAQAEVVAEKVRQQPLLAVAIAVGVGWLIGRAMR